ncbi:conserved unknown protein [Ectocarpus siliculosus]|uniref:Calmodulin n=1 Tax=Ectocarpus siliculosus TaxID=2880 RepID=D8LKJ0_ECTSI|nr:conserved unknown protein [Ectocarpus siliculosus]|eukprot:CBN74580.1 conserved unknown protein [Ectocarpus siliculosus]
MTRQTASEDLSPTELAEFREIFDLVDRDGGGTVTKEELGELMDTLGIEATPEEVDLMIDEIDQDNNGEIDFEEFVAVMSRKVNASYTADQVKSAFKVFEGNSPPGHIKIESVMKALTTYGSEQLTEEQAHDLVSQLEPDHNGVVNYVEYINMMMND